MHVFYCMKGEYHLELINNCMHLLVGSIMIVAIQIFHKIGFSKLDYPTQLWSSEMICTKIILGLFIILIYSF